MIVFKEFKCHPAYPARAANVAAQRQPPTAADTAKNTAIQAGRITSRAEAGTNADTVPGGTGCVPQF